MKSICPTCNSTLFVPNDNRSLRKSLVLCSRCHSIYMVSAGTVVKAWLEYSNHRRVVYQVRIHLQNGFFKTVGLDHQINIEGPIVLLTPLKGLGRLNPVLLVEAKTGRNFHLIHPRQQIRKFQFRGAIGAAALIVCLGMGLKGTISTIVFGAVVSGIAVSTVIKKIHRGEEKNLQLRDRLLLEQHLLKQSEVWGQRFSKLHQELSILYTITHPLSPDAKHQAFCINALAEHPQEQHYYENRYNMLNELIEHYLLAKSLVDTSVPLMQLTSEVPNDLNDKLIKFAQKIEHLEHEYQVNKKIKSLQDANSTR